MKNFVVALLVAVNLFLGAGLIASVWDEPTALAAAPPPPPADYMIIPLGIGAGQSVFSVINPNTRKVAVFRFQGNRVEMSMPPVDISRAFEIR